MNLDDFPLSAFTVICDGSACGSGGVAEHVHESEWVRSLGLVKFENGKRRYVSLASVG